MELVMKDAKSALEVSETTFGREFNEGGAIRSILSELVRQERLIVVEKFGIEAPKTKELIAKLKEMELTDVLIVTAEVDENLFLAARNLYKVDVRDVAGIDPVSLIAFDKVLMTADAVKQIEEMLA